MDARVGSTNIARKVWTKVFPDHWSFLLGEVALYSFVFLLLSGVFLTLFYEPSMEAAVYEGPYAPVDGTVVPASYGSVLRLSFEVQAGLLIRQAHHWAALIFVAAIVLHLGRIFFTGAFRRPREVNWVVGVLMLLLAVVNGFAGYSLPFDMYSGTALRFLHATLLSIPLVGPWLDFLVFGSEFPGEEVISRLFVLHVLLVPAALLALLTLHMVLLVHQKHTQFAGPGRTEHNVVGTRLWPRFAVRTTSLLFTVFAVLFLLGGLAQINPVWLRGPFEPSTAPSPAQPDWYLGFVDGALRLWPAWEPTVFGYVAPNVLVPTVLLLSVTVLLLLAWPFVEPLVTKDRDAHQILERPRERPGRVAAGTGIAAFYGVLTIASADDVIARFLDVRVEGVILALRVLLLVTPVVAAALAFLLARALLLSGAPRLSALRWPDLRAATRRSPRS